VDIQSHASALAAGGRTILVLPEGIMRFRVRRGEFDEVWDPSRAAVVSQFSPFQSWRAGAAMTRNGVISGLSAALIVVEASERGGTLAAGLHGLDRGQKVIVLAANGGTRGNEILLSRGAVGARNR